MNNEDELTKNQIEKNIEDIQKELEEKLNQLKYLQADFDNYKKQFEKEKEIIIKLANENLIKELIIILDDFEQALKQIENEKNKEGLELLHKKFFNILEKHGLKKIEALGNKFDPNFHEALMKEISDKENGTIIEELQKGFMLKSKVIRPSRVKIAENKEGE
jgi:molecular chaperone GrpE